MKKFLITLLFSITIGGLCGFFAYKKFNNNNDAITTILERQVYAFQVGIFTNLDNAQELSNKYNGIVINDNDKYRVYVALASSSNALTILKKYYDNLGIAYYIKQINVSDNLLNALDEYESVLIATTEENYNPIIKNILSEYQKELT